MLAAVSCSVLDSGHPGLELHGLLGVFNGLAPSHDILLLQDGLGLQSRDGSVLEPSKRKGNALKNYSGVNRAYTLKGRYSIYFQHPSKKDSLLVTLSIFRCGFLWMAADRWEVQRGYGMAALRLYDAPVYSVVIATSRTIILIFIMYSLHN